MPPFTALIGMTSWYFLLPNQQGLNGTEQLGTYQIDFEGYHSRESVMDGLLDSQNHQTKSINDYHSNHYTNQGQ